MSRIKWTILSTTVLIIAVSLSTYIFLYCNNNEKVVTNAIPPEYAISPLVKDQLEEPFITLKEIPSFGELALMSKLDISTIEMELSTDNKIDIRHSEISPDGQRIALLIDSKAEKELWIINFTGRVADKTEIRMNDNFTGFRMIHWDQNSPDYLYGEALFKDNEEFSHQIWRFRYDGKDFTRISKKDENAYLGAVYTNGNYIIGLEKKATTKNYMSYFIQSLRNNDNREQIKNPRYFTDLQLWDFSKSRDEERISPNSSFSAFSIPVIALGSEPPVDNAHIAIIDHATQNVFAMIFDQQLFYGNNEHIIFKHQNFIWLPDSSGYFVCFTPKNDPFNEKSAELWYVLLDGTEKRLINGILLIAASSNGQNILLKYKGEYYLISTGTKK